ncbi:MAG TPA: PEP-CTERM sorting domain-containing protein [Edaphobacter sp.]
MKKTSLSLVALVLALFFGSVAPAMADSFTLDGVVGSTVSFDTTIDNTTSDVLWLNGGNATFDNDTTGVLAANFNDLLFVNFLDGINPGSSASGTLFTLALPTDLAPGVYTLTYLLTGGADFDAQNLIKEYDITINAQAQGGPAPVPEPATWLLFGTGALLGATVLVRRTA